MLATIIFFIFLFTCFALYYIRFIVHYAINKKPNPIFQTVHVIRSKVYPLEKRVDFCIDEHYLRYGQRSESEIAREMAAKYVCDEFYEWVKQDRNNEIFKLIKEERMFDRDRIVKYRVMFSVIPQFETRIPYGCKLI